MQLSVTAVTQSQNNGTSTKRVLGLLEIGFHFIVFFVLRVILLIYSNYHVLKSLGVE